MYLICVRWRGSCKRVIVFEVEGVCMRILKWKRVGICWVDVL